MINKVLTSAFIALAISIEASAGVWGVGSFENDSALDWMHEFEHSKTSKALISVFRKIPRKGYIEADSCSKVMAASEIVASLKDGNMEQLPNSIVGWVKSNRASYSPLLSEKALEAINYCKDDGRSELAQLWRGALAVSWGKRVSHIEVRLK